MKRALIALFVTSSLYSFSYLNFLYPNSGKSLFTQQDKFLVSLSEFVLILKQIEDLDISGRELRRTVYQQKKYLKDGLSQTMNSKHLESLAIDLEFRYKGIIITNREHYLMHAIADLWECLDKKNESGYFWFFRDNGHFQRNR